MMRRPNDYLMLPLYPLPRIERLPGPPEDAAVGSMGATYTLEMLRKAWDRDED